MRLEIRNMMKRRNTEDDGVSSEYMLGKEMKKAGMILFSLIKQRSMREVTKGSKENEMVLGE